MTGNRTLAVFLPYSHAYHLEIRETSLKAHWAPFQLALAMQGSSSTRSCVHYWGLASEWSNRAAQNARAPHWLLSFVTLPSPVGQWALFQNPQNYPHVAGHAPPGARSLAVASPPAPVPPDRVAPEERLRKRRLEVVEAKGREDAQVFRDQPIICTPADTGTFGLLLTLLLKDILSISRDNSSSAVSPICCDTLCKRGDSYIKFSTRDVENPPLFTIFIPEICREQGGKTQSAGRLKDVSSLATAFSSVGWPLPHI
ncbi:hypothetical protein DFP72DRAFT_863029 [Ephemerocybe angulata]|uniref:Uncharacterized protein n=1 Tax=Ephemerocybe angulata TaxID=980116 RepID=A0A8H6H616_9AGAR|nr:hypothetical protein DFP72DRAFT_863029 [Tulosesus angulatus]